MELTSTLIETRDKIEQRPITPGPKRTVIRRTSLIAIALIVAFGAISAWSQEWSRYVALEDFFSIDFPGEPTVRETTYRTELGIVLPARIYTAEGAFGRFSVTVVDWRDTDELYEAFLAGCQDCDGAMPNDIRGAALHAAFSYLESGSEATYLAQNTVEEVRGVRIHVLNEDGSRTAAASHWHEYRLYIIEATAPSGPPRHFLESIEFIDQVGRPIQYQSRYAPLFPKPSRSQNE